MEKTIEETTPTSQTKARNPFIAFLLSLFFPGMGQVYNGQPKKAVLLFGLVLFLPWVFGLLNIATFLNGLILVMLVEIALRIYMITDAVIHAKKQKAYVLKSYNTWHYHLLIVAGIVGATAFYDMSSALGIQTFKIPTISNEPTLLEGDRLVADLKAYEQTNPDYGDMVVFFKPSHDRFYIFRVVGLPGDKLEINDNSLIINEKPVKSTFIKKVLNQEMPALEFEEQLPNGHKHLIYKLEQPYNQTTANVKDIIVPPNHYYLLGDNRDFAADSRFYGFISKKEIKGRVIYSYWGENMDRINLDFKKH